MKEKQASSRHCFVCGVENPVGLRLGFFTISPGEVHANVRLPDQYEGYPGIAHGGVIAAMLDEAAGRSQMGDTDNPRFMFTARLNISYRRNVPVNRPLHLVGKAGMVRGRKAEATSALYDQDGNLLAEADALLINVDREMMDAADLEALGWKVYPAGAAVEAESPTGGVNEHT